ncbi:MAG: hypothetical protein DRP94_04690 [Candidatus Latescibacterota bacterium]|nr:MAG: hypothetical protein DRP94_04690 [Candidatus Latescibacterota bacterium]RKY74886.1 MAG: hypothetical protein DRQ14_00530 [Candidatus Latescibacterota bacterium]HDI00347.1 hypothetical protein [Bacillota bacterium]
MEKSAVLLVVLGLALAVPVGAQEITGYIFQFPDDKVPTIDGDLSDWDIVPEQYWIWEKDMIQEEGAEFDPSDHNMKFAWGWNDSQNRLYFACWVYDDAYMASGEYFSIYVDPANGDYGPDEIYVTEPVEEKERWFFALAQKYYVMRPEKGTTMYSYNTSDPDWDCMPPYGDHAYKFLKGSIGCDCPAEMTLEMMITPWEDLNTRSGETAEEAIGKCKIVDLTEGNIVGIEVCKKDSDPGEDPVYRAIPWAGYFADNAALWGDYILAPLEVSVEPTTWARIKASFR